jgi:hypothetical protein
MWSIHQKNNYDFSTLSYDFNTFFPSSLRGETNGLCFPSKAWAFALGLSPLHYGTPIPKKISFIVL